jgi:hypothetical protein
LLAKRAQLFRAVTRINAAVITLCWPVAVFFRWHGLGSGTKFVFLKSKIVEQSRSYGPELGRRWMFLRKLVDQWRCLVALMFQSRWRGLIDGRRCLVRPLRLRARDRAPRKYKRRDKANENPSGASHRGNLTCRGAARPRQALLRPCMSEWIGTRNAYGRAAAALVPAVSER